MAETETMMRRPVLITTIGVTVAALAVLMLGLQEIQRFQSG